MTQHVGKTGLVRTPDGKLWHLSRKERRHTVEFEQWAVTRLRDPRIVAKEAVQALALEEFDILRSPKYTDEQKQALIEAGRRQQAVYAKEALDAAGSYLSYSSEAQQRLLNTEEGAVKMLSILLRDRHPEVTEEEARTVLESLGTIGWAQALEDAEGKPSPKGKAPAANGAHQTDLSEVSIGGQ